MTSFSISTFTTLLAERPMTNVVAVVAVASPAWLEALKEVSGIAGLILPVAGVAWLTIQMVTHFTRNKK